MPNIKSAMKRVKVIKTKTLQNTVKKSILKSSIRKFKEAVANNDDSASELLKKAYKAIDIAAKGNIIHKNTAARKKSRLTKYLNVANSNK